MTNKDWTGNTKSMFSPLGSSSHSEHDREQHDYYATETRAIEILLEQEPDLYNVWECACGEGHLAKILDEQDRLQMATDLIDRGYGVGGVDFLNLSPEMSWNIRTNIITNPPYKHAKEFVEKSLEIVEKGYKVAMFLKLTFLEGKERKKLFALTPPPERFTFRALVSNALLMEISLQLLHLLQPTHGLFGRRDLKETQLLNG